MAETGAPAATENRRQYQRCAVSLEGRLFVPAENTDQPCRILDLSAGSARIACEDVPPPSTYVVLYVEGFGRFSSVTTRYEDGAIALRFDLSEAGRKKLTAQIAAYLKSRVPGVTASRRHKRVATPAAGSLRRQSGEQAPCSIRDLSLKGAFLETRCRPPLGEVISIGPYSGGVIRHEPKGIAIQFIATPGNVTAAGD